MTETTGCPHPECSETSQSACGAGDCPNGTQTTEQQWTCFHCSETFTDREDAWLHFGDNDGMSAAACQIDIKAFREMETLLARYRSEDSDTDRRFYRMQAEHTVKLREAEESGYRRGLVDQVYTNG